MPTTAEVLPLPAEQQETERRIVDGETLLGEGHQRRPAGDAAACDEKGEARGETCRRAIVRNHEHFP
jgi:hypothetical protein